MILQRLRRWRSQRRYLRLANIDCPTGFRHDWHKLTPGDRVGEHEFVRAKAWTWREERIEYPVEGYVCMRCQMTNVKILTPETVETMPAFGYIGLELK